ncbi:MAG: hypothetical protein OEM52_02070 [bacterium]|nr:hypothetical protein [bacterium]
MTPEQLAARKLLLKMFTTSHGRNIIDSGSAYGYSSDYNARLGLDQQPLMLKHEWITHNRGTHDTSVHSSYQVNTLKYIEAFVSGIHQPLQTACDEQELTFSGNCESMNNFITTQYPDLEVDCYAYGYTYNMGGQCHLHNDIVYGLYFVKPFGASNEFREAILGLQVHVGCDARWGFSYPGFFKIDGYDVLDGFLMGLSNASIYCSECDACWDTQNGGYNWSGRPRSSSGNVLDLNDFVATTGRTNRSGIVKLSHPRYGDTYLKARCPMCQKGILSVDVNICC